MIGRHEEKRILKLAYAADRPEFVVVYGRRRIGKTYLVRQVLGNAFTFAYTGALNCSTKVQLACFHQALIEQGLHKSPIPQTWPEAFNLLQQLIDKSTNDRKVIFIDEMPWLDRPRSGFLAAFEYFWNGWASARNDVMLVVCGSATSWITNKIFRNRGGLHNRVTRQIQLSPFSLYECELFADSLNLGMTRNQILEGYMVMGGVALYWSKLDCGKSLAQNINDLFLSPTGELRNEFHDLYASIFSNPDKHIKVIEALATKRMGLTRDSIVRIARLDSSGNLTTVIRELVECGFVRKYCHTSKKVKDALYQLVDPYTIFYYQFVKDAYGTDEDYWLKLQESPAYRTWCGLAFECVCLLHSRQIKAALGISGIMARLYSWHVAKTDCHPGVQIDLLIDRADKVVNLCEMKYAPDGYTMSASEADRMRIRRSVLRRYTPDNKAIHLVMITSNGFATNRRPIDINRELTADQLFTQ